MKKYVCDACGWEYDEAAGLPPELSLRTFPRTLSALFAELERICSARHNQIAFGG